jgi:hypothetical protein
VAEIVTGADPGLRPIEPKLELAATFTTRDLRPMSRTVTELRVFVSSPGDLGDHRERLRNAIASWNAAAGARAVRLEPVLWESHTSPAYGKPPQAVINPCLDDCDFGVAIVWTRLGTPTAKAASGTVEEIQRLTKLGRPVLLYVCDEPVGVDRIDARQVAARGRWLRKIESKSRYQRVNSWDALYLRLPGDLQRTIDEMDVARLEPIRLEKAEDPAALYQWAAAAFATSREVYDVTLGRQPFPHQRVRSEQEAVKKYRAARQAFLSRRDAIGYYELVGYDPANGNASDRYRRILETAREAQHRRSDPNTRLALQQVTLLTGIEATVPTIDFLVTDTDVVLLQVAVVSNDSTEFRYRYLRVESHTFAEAYREFFRLLVRCGWQIRVHGEDIEVSRGGGVFTPLARPRSTEPAAPSRTRVASRRRRGGSR